MRGIDREQTANPNKDELNAPVTGWKVWDVSKAPRKICLETLDEADARKKYWELRRAKKQALVTDLKGKVISFDVFAKNEPDNA